MLSGCRKDSTGICEPCPSRGQSIVFFTGIALVIVVVLIGTMYLLLRTSSELMHEVKEGDEDDEEEEVKALEVQLTEDLKPELVSQADKQKQERAQQLQRVPGVPQPLGAARRKISLKERGSWVVMQRVVWRLQGKDVKEQVCVDSTLVWFKTSSSLKLHFQLYVF